MVLDIVLTFFIAYPKEAIIKLQKEEIERANNDEEKLRKNIRKSDVKINKVSINEPSTSIMPIKEEKPHPNIADP